MDTFEENIGNLKPKSNRTEKNPDEVGAIWERASNTSGTPYLSMKLTLNGVDYNLKAFKNGKKINENQPEWLVFTSKNIRKDINENK
jgi:hypothetical protein